MVDGTSLGTSTSSAGHKRLTFAIYYGLPYRHPGIIHIEEIQAGGSERRLSQSHFELYDPRIARAGLGLLIGKAIVDDLLTPRQGRYKGPRFDFQSDCEICLIRKTGVDAGLLGRGGSARYTKTPIGTAHIPGDLARDEVCAAIAATFNAGWERLAEEAYVHPSQVASGTGAVVYDHMGWRFSRIACFESNFRQIVGPVVFFAYQDERITEFATLHQGHGPAGSIVNYYRLYGFLYTPQGPWLIEKGTSSLSVPIRIPRYHPWDDLHRRGEGDTKGDWEVFSDTLVSFWHLSDEGIKIIGGVPPAPDFPTSESLDELEQMLQTTHTNCSIYCSSCKRDYRPDISVRELEVFSSRGDLLDVCAHCYYCPHCRRWSTPTERDQAFTWNERCEHIKERGARSAFGHYIPDRDLTQVSPSPIPASLQSRQPLYGMSAGTSDRQEGQDTIAPALTRPTALNESVVQVERLQLFASVSEKLQIGRDLAMKSLALFWKQVERTPSGCWLWRGERSNTTLYFGVSWRPSSRRVEAEKLAWTLGTGQILRTHSRLLLTCESPDCFNPEHKIEFVWLSDIWWWLRPKDQIGEDDWQEIVYRFKQQVDEGRIPILQQREGSIAVRREAFDSWMHEEGNQLISEFSYKYRVKKATAASRAQDSSPSKDRPQVAEGKNEAWWKRFTEEQTAKLVKRFQQLARLEGEGTFLDQTTARRNLERFFSRIAIAKGGCWRWNWGEPQFRLYKYGPWVNPRELAWWLSRGTLFRGLDTRIASHNGRSWCINPAHSDVEFTTVSAAMFLLRTTTPSKPGIQDDDLHSLDEPVQDLRHRIHQAIERRELPYRLDERTLSLKLWRSDVMTWWETLEQPSGAKP
jgi:hypothetical protein